MSQNNSPSQWPKAFVAMSGLFIIGATAYALKDADVMWSLLLLIWLLDWF